MLFEQIIGQQIAKTGFFSFVEADRLPHALLINGKQGSGGLSFALAIAQYLLCENKSAHDACGACAACNKVQKLAHPDLHFSFPTIPPKPGSKASSKHYMAEFRSAILENPYISTYDWLQYINAENKQGNITAEECREIVDQLQLKAFEGGYKIQIIWRPEYLGKEGNILLKLIEEPPAQTMLILISEEVEDILNTILSRTQLIQLAPLQVQEIADGLQRFYQVDAQKANQIALIADSDFGQALQLREDTGNNNLTLMKDWFNGIFTNNGVLMHEWVENTAKLGREQQKNLLIYAQQMLAFAMRSALIEGYQMPLMEDESSFVRKIGSRNYSLDVYQNLDEALTTACYHIERNAHGKTQLLYTTIQLQYIFQGRNL